MDNFGSEPYGQPLVESGAAKDAAPPPKSRTELAQAVYVVGFRIPFFDLVGLMVKVSLAAIPAAIILAIIYAAAAAVFFSAFGTGGIFGHRN